MNNNYPDIVALVNNFVLYNDQSSFNTFFKLYYSKMVEFSMLFTKDEEVAKEVVSDVFFKILKNKKQLLKVNSIQNYLFLSCKNQSLTHLKKNSRQSFDSLKSVENSGTSINTTPETQILDKELEYIVQQTIREFPPKRRMVFKLIKDEGLSYKEVAKLLNISTKTVDNHLSSAISVLKQKVHHYLSDQKIPIMKIAKMIILLMISYFFIYPQIIG